MPRARTFGQSSRGNRQYLVECGCFVEMLPRALNEVERPGPQRHRPHVGILDVQDKVRATIAAVK